MTPRTDEHKVDWRNARPADPAPALSKWRARLSNAAIAVACLIALAILYARSQRWIP